MTRKLMVEFIYPGILFSDTGSGTEVGHRDPGLVDVPTNAYAFRFYDRVEQTATLEDGRETEHVERENISGWFYPTGTVQTLDQVPDTPENRILRSNMEGNGYARVVRINGAAYPLEDADVVLTP